MDKRTTENMAVELRDTRTGRTRTLAVAPGLTHDEAVAYAHRWMSQHEEVAQFVVYT